MVVVFLGQEMLRKALQAIAISGACTAGAVYQYTRKTALLSSPPSGTLLDDMRKRGLATDCFELRVDGNGSGRGSDSMGDSTPISIEHFVRAFLRSRVFSLERFLLSKAGGELAKNVFTNDEIKEFELEIGDHVSAIFQVVDKRHAGSNELVMCWDEGFQGHTWLQVQPGTLRFGSAYDPSSVQQFSHPHAFSLMSVFHRCYSRVLLVAASNQLARDIAAES